MNGCRHQRLFLRGVCSPDRSLRAGPECFLSRRAGGCGLGLAASLSGVRHADGSHGNRQKRNRRAWRLGAWGAVAGELRRRGAFAIGGLLRDLVAMLVQSGDATASIATRASGYASVYMLEIALLLAGLARVGAAGRPAAQPFSR